MLTLRPQRGGLSPLKLSARTGAIDLGGSYSDDLGFLTQKKFDRLQSRLSIVTGKGEPALQLQTFWQRHCEGLEQAFGALAQGQGNLSALVKGLLETQKAASQAQSVAAQATEVAQRQADLQRVRDSYSDDNVLSAGNSAGSVTVSIAPHNRNYLDPVEAVPVEGGSIPNLAAATVYFIYYDDPAMTGGGVAYRAARDNATAVASLSNPFRHFVGTIQTPTNTGGGSTGVSQIPPWKLGYKSGEFIP